MTRLFITGTGTGVGKTFVTAALTAAARAQGKSVRAVKPIVSGFDRAALTDSDCGVLLAAAGLPASALDGVSPWRFAAPLSPDMAAAREGRTIDWDALLGFTESVCAGPEEIVLVEGVGGILVPIDARHTVADWIKAVRLDVVVVAGSYLGTISHTLAALSALAARGIEVFAVIVSESLENPVPVEETVETLRRFTAVPIGIVRRRSGGQPWRDVAELKPLLDRRSV